jgi:helicase MOV-10
VSYDLRHTLGFVANPRRFNGLWQRLKYHRSLILNIFVVAITRAKALLIIVGDPLVLALDPLWRSFLNYIYLNRGWAGPDISWDPKAPVNVEAGYDKDIRQANDLDMNEFTMRLENLTLTEVEEGVDANIDRPWRELE